MKVNIQIIEIFKEKQIETSNLVQELSFKGIMEVLWKWNRTYAGSWKSCYVRPHVPFHGSWYPSGNHISSKVLVEHICNSHIYEHNQNWWTTSLWKCL